MCSLWTMTISSARSSCRCFATSDIRMCLRQRGGPSIRGIPRAGQPTLQARVLPEPCQSFSASCLVPISIVDPDNRRPVDYRRRRDLLQWLAGAARGQDKTALAGTCWTIWKTAVPNSSSLGVPWMPGADFRRYLLAAPTCPLPPMAPGPTTSWPVHARRTGAP